MRIDTLSPRSNTNGDHDTEEPEGLTVYIAASDPPSPGCRQWKERPVLPVVAAGAVLRI